ncbi:UNVERIFIED_CONTAM: hypothetical protein Sradi_4541000 [Sesamum radiatum]|uniref:Uncharacterized protein n=1 Tax=Sesamum radiatum TaxID=300843 RepID=A0AAW2NBH7_SESRA
MSRRATLSSPVEGPSSKEQHPPPWGPPDLLEPHLLEDMKQALGQFLGYLLIWIRSICQPSMDV